MTSLNTIERHLDYLYRHMIMELRGHRLVLDGEVLSLVYDLPDLRYSKNFGSLSDSELFRLGVCSVPSEVLNALVCASLAERFGEDIILCGCCYRLNGSWRLDLDPKLSSRGLLLPARNQRGLITHLLVFRYPDDPYPFKLKLREDAKNEPVY